MHSMVPVDGSHEPFQQRKEISPEKTEAGGRSSVQNALRRHMALWDKSRTGTFRSSFELPKYSRL